MGTGEEREQWNLSRLKMQSKCFDGHRANSIDYFVNY